MPEIADGVFQLEIPMRYNPLGRTYSYLLLDSCTLIDTGVQSKEAFKAMLEQLKGLGMNVKDLEQIILTHLHRDHTGLVDRIRKVSEVRILAHEEAVEIQKRWAALGRRGYEETRDETKMWGGGGLLDILSRYEQAFRRPRPSLKIDGTVADGATLELEGSMLHVIWTPGHSRDHICIHDQGRELLFSGDHVLPKITSHISLHTFQKGDPLADYLRSLERLRGLGVSIVLPGHEGVFKDLEGRINKLERHHEIRCGEIKGALGQGAETVFEVSSRVSWESRPWYLMSFWTKRMAAAETYAHLVYMRNRGEVEETVQEGVLRYSLR